MGAARFVGRVGGLAVAFGIGTAVLGGIGSAWAERGESSPSSTSSERSSGKARGPSSTPARRAASASPAAKPAAANVPTVTTRRSTATASAPAETISPAASTFTEAVEGPIGELNPSPLVPAEPPVDWAALAGSRRAQTWTDKGITVNYEAIRYESTIIGGFTATSERENAVLSYTALSGSNGGKLALNTVPFIPAPTQNFSALPYATWLDPNGTKGIEKFRLGIREYTIVDALLFGIPVLGTAALPIVNFLQDTPLIGDLLAPIIGYSVVAELEIDVNEFAPGDTPVAFTYKVPSFDGVKISTNFFPAVNLAAGQSAPTAVIAPGFGAPGITNPFSVYALKDEVPGVRPLRLTGYNVVSYDPRGEYDSGGVVQMANPSYEGRDVSELISWIAASTPAALNKPNDPKVGLLGGSYGAALQFAAASDGRIDAMVPVDGWDTLLSSFYPSGTFKTGYGALMLLSLITSGARVNPQLVWAVGTGLLFNWLGPLSQNLMNASTPPLNTLTAPTLLIRGTADVMFPLEQGTASAETIMARGVPMKMLWFCGGHGICLNPYGKDQTAAMNNGTAAWLNQYVAGVGSQADALPNFQWFDQYGTSNTSTLMPFQQGFNDLPDVVATDRGGLLGIVPILGGSGPGAGPAISSFVNASVAGNAINVTVPTDKLVPGTQVVGAPTVSFTYRGLGTSGAVFAQVVDKKTGFVLGNVVTPVPVRLDGFERTVSVDISEIAYTVSEGDSLEVQITSSATPFENLSFGVIDISDITVTLPNRTTSN